MISFNFAGKEKYDCIDLVYKTYPKKSFSIDMLCEVLETRMKEEVQLILDQMILEGKLEQGPIDVDGKELWVYASKEAYVEDGV